jgi:hypothetical protein
MASQAQWTSTFAAFVAAATWFFRGNQTNRHNYRWLWSFTRLSSNQTLGEKLSCKAKLPAIAVVFAGISTIAQGLTQLLVR